MIRNLLTDDSLKLFSKRILLKHNLTSHKFSILYCIVLSNEEIQISLDFHALVDGYFRICAHHSRTAPDLKKRMRKAYWFREVHPSEIQKLIKKL